MLIHMDRSTSPAPDLDTVRAIVTAAGGARAIETASQGTPRPVKAKTVYSWFRIGIPERNWPLITRLSSATVEQIHNANLALAAAQPVAEGQHECAPAE